MSARGEVPAGAVPEPTALLVVDDEPGMRNFLQKALAHHYALVEATDTVERAERLRERYHFDLILLDVRLRGTSGVDWLVDLRARDVGTEVIVMTAYAELSVAIAALRAGAADFLLKPFHLDQLLSSVAACLERRRIRRENVLLRRALGAADDQGIIGTSAAIREVRALVERVAPVPSTLLITGETGTGKELIARAVHRRSGRAGPFVPVNCGSIPGELLESELFGHVKGAFTGAVETREGLFSQANQGTLFLDEIAELPRHLQAKLLRALEERAIRPVGADRQVPVDTRIIAATNRPLGAQVRSGRFRDDLYYRLDVLSLHIVPLRERTEDIEPLARHFMARLAAQLALAPLAIDRGVVERMRGYAWPGNVRELRNVIERALLLGDAQAFVPAATPAPAAGAVPGADWPLERVERWHMLRVLEAAGGNRSAAARRLGVARRTLERKLAQWRGEESG